MGHVGAVFPGRSRCVVPRGPPAVPGHSSLCTQPSLSRDRTMSHYDRTLHFGSYITIALCAGVRSGFDQMRHPRRSSRSIVHVHHHHDHHNYLPLNLRANLAQLGPRARARPGTGGRAGAFRDHTGITDAVYFFRDPGCVCLVACGTGLARISRHFSWRQICSNLRPSCGKGSRKNIS